jgi:hypothetical protein
MSNIPYADLGEASGENTRALKNVGSEQPVPKYSEEDKLSETGDIGVSDKVYASYQVIHHCCFMRRG